MSRLILRQVFLYYRVSLFIALVILKDRSIAHKQPKSSVTYYEAAFNEFKVDGISVSWNYVQNWKSNFCDYQLLFLDTQQKDDLSLRIVSISFS